tara:strand:- start:342 stop:773 length:432 start_codon:yes stop_codon:yes gene_type:complete
MNFISNSEKDTFHFASNLAQSIKVGSVIALLGNLGSGKTTFAKGFAMGLNITENVGSPTFKIISEYVGNPHNLYHIDSYRLEDENDFLKIGGEEFLNQKRGVTLIEWASLIKGILPSDTIFIYFKRLSKKNTRQIRIEGLEDE